MKKIIFAFVMIGILSFYVSAQNDVETYKKNSRSLEGEGKFAEAVLELGKAIMIAPNNADLYLRRANAHLGLKDVDGMKQDLYKAVALNPDDEITVLGAAQIWFHAQIFGREFCRSAASILDPFLINHPNADQVFQFRAIAKQCAGDFFGAYEDFSKAAELKPDNQLYKSDAARSLANLGDSPQAVERLNKIITESEAKLSVTKDKNEQWQLQFTVSRLYGSRSFIYEKQGNTEAMFADLNKMVEILPHQSSYIMRAKAFIRHKNYAAAVNDYNEIITLQPKDVSNYMERGDLYFRLEKFSDALNDYEKALTLNENTLMKPMLERRIEMAKQKIQANSNQRR